MKSEKELADTSLTALRPQAEALPSRAQPADELPRTASRPAHEARRLLALLSADVLAMMASVVVGVALLDVLRPGRHHSVTELPYAFVVVPIFLLSFALHGLYRRDRTALQRPVASDVVRLAQALLTGVVFVLLVESVRQSLWDPDIVLVQAVLLAAAGLVTVPVLRGLVRSLGVETASARQLRILVVGSGVVADRVVARLRRSSKVTVLGLVDDDPPPGYSTLGPIGDLPELCRELRIDRVLVAFSRTPTHDVVDYLYNLPDVTISVIPRMYEMLTWRSQLEEIDGIPVISVAQPQLGLAARATKRALDLVVSSLTLAVLLPLGVACALAIKLSSPGPVFFRQERGGLDGKPFRIFKFRTMAEDAADRRHEVAELNDGDGPVFKIKADPRVTRIGSMLRRASIDELPQLINVLVGDMSLVGPRPFPIEDSRQIVGRAAARFHVKPGMTGLWQVSGRSELSYDDLRHLDSVYVASWSLWWDLKILMQTPGAVLRGQGAF